MKNDAELLWELDEHVSVDAKTASDVGKWLLETICAFSNEPDLGGGYVLLGMAPAEDSFWPTYEAVGVNEPDKIQTDIASQCATVLNVNRGSWIEGAIGKLQVSIDRLRRYRQTLISVAVTGKIQVAQPIGGET